MPSSEKILSPGVFTNEIDQTFLPAAVADIGAALIGPTVKGPAGIPKVVNSFSEYQTMFGDSFKSGSGTYSYFTSITAREYLKHADKLTVIRILAAGSAGFGNATAFVPTGSGNFHTGSTVNNYTGSGAFSFKLHTLADGSLQNGVKSGKGGLEGADSGQGTDLGKNNILLSGSSDNLRWEISTTNPKKGTFTLLIRRGTDTHKRKQPVENWNNLSLDPNATNYIAKVIGDQDFWLVDSGGTRPYLQASGSYPNNSKYVRVEVAKSTLNYLNENGEIRDNVLSSSLPGLNSGSFSEGSDGYVGFDGIGAQKGSTSNEALFYSDITDGNAQGFDLNSAANGKTAYEDAINLLANQDEFDINLVMMPGVTDEGNGGGSLVTTAINMCEDRGDCFVVADPTLYGSALSTAKDQAKGRDSNYAAMYYPWVQVSDASIGRNVWAPPSTVIGGVYSFNDKVAHPWFAPAGLNRGGIDMAVQAERKLTRNNRDDLYDFNINPVATFPGQGICVWGQKTLQKKASALDRVNVRRLLIKVKKFIASSSRFLVFEQNNSKTRRRFLNIVNPFLEQVQSNSGLTTFKVVMDETNNTQDVVDRNILYGQIFLQPTRTAEFVVLDFTVQPTGATFPE